MSNATQITIKSLGLSNLLHSEFFRYLSANKYSLLHKINTLYVHMFVV